MKIYGVDRVVQILSSWTNANYLYILSPFDGLECLTLVCKSVEYDTLSGSYLDLI